MRLLAILFSLAAVITAIALGPVALDTTATDLDTTSADGNTIDSPLAGAATPSAGHVSTLNLTGNEINIAPADGDIDSSGGNENAALRGCGTATFGKGIMGQILKDDWECREFAYDLVGVFVGGGCSCLLFKGYGKIGCNQPPLKGSELVGKVTGPGQQSFQGQGVRFWKCGT